MPGRTAVVGAVEITRPQRSDTTILSYSPTTVILWPLTDTFTLPPATVSSAPYTIGVADTFGAAPLKSAVRS